MEVGQRFNASKGDGPEGSSSPDTIKHSSHSLLSATFNDAVELFTVKVSLNSNTNAFPNNSKDSLQEQENGWLMPIFPASLGHWGLSCLGLIFFPPVLTIETVDHWSPPFLSTQFTSMAHYLWWYCWIQVLLLESWGFGKNSDLWGHQAMGICSL